MALVTYGLSPEYEQIVAVMCATRPEFWSRIGHALKPGGFDSEEAALIISAVREYVDSGASAPESWLHIREWLRKGVTDGTVDPKDYRHAKVFVEEGIALIDDASVTVDSAIKVIRPSIVSEHQRVEMEKMVTAFQHGKDLSISTSALQSIEHLGEKRAEKDVDLESSLDGMLKRRRMRHMDTGIDELDVRLGGVMAGQEIVVVGGPGDGKSMFLSQVAAHACESSLNVLVATLEVSVDIWYSRVHAGMLRVPQEALMSGDPGVISQAKSKLMNLLPVCGNLTVRYFTPNATTVTELLKWVSDKEREWHQPVDVLVIDYADKISPDGKVDKFNTYHAMNDVYERLRVWAEERKCWLYTASQAKGRSSNDRKRKRDVEDAADSMGKGRVCDMMLTLNAIESDGEREMSIFVAKNRNGLSKFSVGPLATDFAYGRLTK